MRLASSDQPDGGVDVPSGRFGIGTRLFRRVQERLRDLTIQARQAHVQASPQAVTVVTRAEIDLSVDDGLRLEPDFPLRGNNLYRTEEATRPARGEQLFGIGSVARSAGSGE